METNEPSGYNLIDISIKRLVRDNPAAFLELAGLSITPDHVTFEDTAIQQRERRADHICIITDDNGVRRGVLYLEYQLVPDPAITEATVREQVALIRSAELDEERKDELLSLSFIVASRDVTRGILLRILKEVFTMKTLPPIVEDMFGDALREREALSARNEARATLVRLYTKRLGAPPAEAVARLEAIENIENLHAMIDRYDEQIESWEQLLPPVSTD